MADLAILTAVSGSGWESELVSAIERAPGGLYVARRCVDLADLVATAAAGHGRAVLLSADFRQLDRDVVARLNESRVAVVGVTPHDDSAVDRLRSLGVTDVVPADVGPDDLANTVLAAVAAVEGGQPTVAVDSAIVAIADNLSAADTEGSIVAVWGPGGAPGRTTIATNLAAELGSHSRAGEPTPTLLVDADTYGASVAQTIGLLDEAPGLAGASRAANNGDLDAAALARYTRQVVPGLQVLTGINRTSRWPEIRPSSLEIVWRMARRAAAVTVVDCGFCLERDEALTFDTAAPQRNGATLSALEHADRVIAVGTGDPVGLSRLVRGLSELAEMLPGADVDVVINKVRKSASGRNPEGQITGALQRFAGVEPAAFIPDDQSALDLAMAQGLTLAEVAPDSVARAAIRSIAHMVVGGPPPAVTSARRWVSWRNRL